jgi:hypothetical protein
MKKDDSFARLGRKWHKTRPQQSRSQCFTVGCKNKASLNHLLKQKGIINEISEDGHTQELKHHWFDRLTYYNFKRTGWEETLAMYGYCPTCDSKLFRSIEEPTPKIPTNSREACAYSLRPVVHEIRKKAGNVEYLRGEPVDREVELGRTMKIRNSSLEDLGLILLNSIATSLTEGLTNASPIEFIVRKIGRIEVCASSILFRPSRFKGARVSDFPGMFTSVHLHSFNIINFFPQGAETIIISSTLSDEPRSKSFHQILASADEKTVRRILSNVMINQIEDWAISETLLKCAPTHLAQLINNSKWPNSPLFDHDHGIDLFELPEN